MQKENVYIQSAIENLKRLEEQRSLSAQIYERDKILTSELRFVIVSRNATFMQEQPVPIQKYLTTDKQSLQKFKSKQASHGFSRIDSNNCRKFSVWVNHAIEDIPPRYLHPSRIQCFLSNIEFLLVNLPSVLNTESFALNMTTTACSNCWWY